MRLFQKEVRNMKRLGILFLVLLLLAGCQPTPEADAVRQKNSAKMIEMARGEAAPDESAAPGQAAQEAEAQPAATAVPVKALAADAKGFIKVNATALRA